MFSFDVMKPERIKPGSPSRWWTDTANYCDVSSKHGWHAGMSCGFWIIRNHNMDYLHMQFDELKQNGVAVYGKYIITFINKLS